MKVLVTGGTGFVGAHCVRALRDRGHEVRLLVRSPELLETILGPLGVTVDDSLVGDMTDERAVVEALDGCDAVLHAAAMVATSRRLAGAVLDVNRRGTEHVLGNAAAMGLDPIVHVSSAAVLYPTTEPVVGPDSAVVEPAGAYGRSKAASERYARHLQADGVPVVCTYPATVLGPPAGPRHGETAGILPALLRSRVMTVVGHWSIVDVRDVAAAHAAAMEPGRGPRRYTLGGHFVAVSTLVDLLEQATGHRFRRIPVADALARGVGRTIDLLGRALRFDSPITEEGMTYLTRAVPCDDTRTRTELGVEPRAPLATLRATIAGLVATGELAAAAAGAAAVDHEEA